jgi:hypothetical protein
LAQAQTLPATVKPPGSDSVGATVSPREGAIAAQR